MIYNAFRYHDSSKLIVDYFELTFSEKSLPFENTILPVGLPAITFIEKGKHIVSHNGEQQELQDLVLTGQFFRSYKLIVEEASQSSGITLHPTTLFKLTNKDISLLENKHVLLEEVSDCCHTLLKPILSSKVNGQVAMDKMEAALQSLPKSDDKYIEIIDFAIELIQSKEGLLHVKDLLEEISVSQKTLETQFKKIVGLTPGKYIKLHRFIKLMRRYESQDLKLKDLIFMYNYYDESHFAKDFKLFMKESPKSYFKKDYIFLKKYLKV